MLKEEEMMIKESLQSSGGKIHGKVLTPLKLSRIVGEARDVAEETITSWMERIQELTEGYLSENIWNMDESGCFFKVGLSLFKLKIICFNDSPLKMMKNTFYFISKAIFVLKISKFLS